MKQETIYGVRPVIEAVRSKRREVFEVLDAVENGEVAEAAAASGVSVKKVPRARVEDLARGGAHQGVAARVGPYPYSDLDEILTTPNPLVVVLDGVTDPHNLGALARTAEAAGAQALVCRRHRAARIGNVAVKASAGALIHLPVAEVPNLPRVLGALKDQGFWVVGLDADASSTVYEEAPPGRIALVVGAEGEGLSRLVGEACDAMVSIPLRGKVASLNVSVAAAVILFEAVRQRDD